MRRLTLILSDLYLAHEAGPPSEHSEFVVLPNLEWLLRFARGTAIDDWRQQLAAQTGIALLSQVAPAHFAAHGRIPAERLCTSWFATPVSLEARLDHVRLTPRGLLALTAEERRAWCAAFARTFGPELELHDGGARGFFLSGIEAHQAVTTDPARVLGADIAASLPAGKSVAPLRRLSAEIEMWLHEAPLNRERERARSPRISSLWLWGGGAVVPVPPVARQHDRTFAGEDAWLGALARAQTGVEARPVPQQLADFQADTPFGIVELAPMSAAGESLARLDAQWFGPAREALRGGALDEVVIVANDRHFTIRRRDAWRWWRRAHHWMDLLRRPRAGAQA
jgi:hypothetical protein